MKPIRYEKLVEDYEASLVERLRGHLPSEPFLEMWVPDEDPLKGILNLFEAAQAAGRDRAAVAISAAMLPASRWSELEEALCALGRARVGESAGTVLVEVAGMNGPRRFDDVQPAIRERLRRAGERIEREGPLAPNPEANSVDCTVSGWTLRLALARGADRRILAARHAGGTTPPDRAFLEAFCAEIAGLPLQEAADHGAIRLLHRLRDGGQARHVGGILMPRNVDPAFATLEALIRAALARVLEREGGVPAANVFEVPPSPAWLARSDAERRVEIGRAIAALLAERNLPADAVALAGLENDRLGHPVRVFVAFAAGVDPAAKPALARALEARLKRLVEWRLELYNQERKDSNTIRRL